MTSMLDLITESGYFKSKFHKQMGGVFKFVFQNDRIIYLFTNDDTNTDVTIACSNQVTRYKDIQNKYLSKVRYFIDTTKQNDVKIKYLLTPQKIIKE